jgi:sugar lactone lactonase YvrE
VSEKGLGHLCFKDDRFFVTASQSHAIYEVTLDATAKRILGNGERGIVDGAGAKARLSFPNGIALSPYGQLYLNEEVNESVSSFPPRTIIREMILEPARPSRTTGE